ncbi:MAG: hypothetical protein ACI87H_002838 [Gammaproteobacteria bacterium]
MSIQTQVEYLAYQNDRQQAPLYLASSAGRNARHDIDQAVVYVDIEVDDARQLSDGNDAREFGLHPRGFDLFEHPTRMDDFLDAEKIKQLYETEVETFLKSVTGAWRVHIFDHTVRASDSGLRERKQVREPAVLVHNDYTPSSGFVCLRENLGEEAEALAATRFQIVNLWRPLVNPVEDMPLALCDSRSLAADQLIDTVRQAPNHIGAIQLAEHNASHRWFYYAAMRPPEVLLFKTFDSIDQGRRPCSIHSAIKLPHVAPDAKPRESIESRAFVFYR